MAFAILQKQEGKRHWVHLDEPGCWSFITALDSRRCRVEPPAQLRYAEREAAERDAEHFRQENASQVKATKQQRKYKVAPATYSVLSVE
jgi:hypothetical protein